MSLMSASSFAKRSFGFLAGGLAVAAALTWFFNRRRAMKAIKKAEAQELNERILTTSDNEKMQKACCDQSRVEEISELKTEFAQKDPVNMGEAAGDAGGGIGSVFDDVTDRVVGFDAEKAERIFHDGGYGDANSLSNSSPTSEHSEEDADILNVEEDASVNVHTLNNHCDVHAQRTLEKELNLEAEEASFSWSQEVEKSASKSLNEPMVNGMDEGAVASGISANDGYKLADSPSANSEGSQDSGRATGGLASSMSPADDAGNDCSFRPMYEFEIPNSLVGLIIGIKGKTIKELCTRTDVKMIIRPHHTPSKMDSYQICTVEGPRDNINKCLQMLRRRFPATRFPELNLRPVLPPPIPSPAAELFGTQPTQLMLPEGVRCEVIVSSMVDAGHFFLQQPTHPSFPSLQRLDYYMLGIYSQTTGIPDLPKPCETGLLCVAPASGGWFRAVTVIYYEDQDEVLVRFVDYGGYSRIPRADLRQIRTDFMTLPFQATECYIAHVEPVDGSCTWSDTAMQTFQSLAMGRIIEAFVVGYNVEDLTPVVELFTVDKNNMAVRIDRVLLDAGLAKAADPSKVKRVLPKPMLSPAPVAGDSLPNGSDANESIPLA